MQYSGWIIIGLACVVLIINLALFRLIRIENKEKKKLISELDALQRKLAEYAKLLPRSLMQLLELMNYKEGATPEIGSHNRIETVIADVNMSGFSEYSQSMASSSVVESVNNLLSGIIPAVTQNGGTIEGFSEAGLTALFGNEYEKAVTASISICDGVRQKTGGDEDIAVGICDGSVLLGIVGHEDIMSVLALTGDMDFASFLRSIGYKYNARIIVTSQVLGKIPDAKRRYNCRQLGYICVKSTQTLVQIFDVFDGDSASSRNSKRKTKMVFEKGVALYYGGEILQARQHFVEVLKTDSRDRAAKEYLLLCDGVLNRLTPHVSYIESF